jgi:hypothetical protein
MEVYINMLTQMVKPLMDGIAPGMPYILQQDRVPTHTSQKNQNWCRDNFAYF